MTYAAPLGDIRFVLSEVAGLADVTALPGFEEVTDDIVEAILVEAGRLAEDIIAPLNAPGDRHGCRFENGGVRMPDGFVDAYRRFVDGGWPGLVLPADAGGQALPRLLATAVGEIWTAANMAFALCPMLTQSAADFIAQQGDARLRSLILPKLAAGAWTGTMMLTEPQAGSDLALLRTQAARENDRWRLRGQKIFITYGDHDLTENIIHVVLARTPGAPAGVRGLSVFLVPKILVADDGRLDGANDVRCLSLEHKLGLHASPTAVMAFGESEGAIGWLVGEEGHGLDHMFTMMNAARLGGADPRPVAIIDHPDVQRMLCTIRVEAEASRALAYFAAAALDIAEHHPDDGERRAHLALATLLTPVVKAWCTDIGIDAADIAIQVFGGYGYIEELEAPQLLRDARVAAIYEGTNGIQALDLTFRKVAADGGEAVRILQGRIKRDADGLVRSDDPRLAAIGGSVGCALDAFERTTAWLLATHADDPRRVAAGATPYLELTGIVVGGWLMATAAAAAHRRLASAEGNSRFLIAKINAGRFFAEMFLGRSEALARQVVAAGDVLAGIEPDRDLC